MAGKLYTCVVGGKRGFKWTHTGECHTYEDAGDKAAAKARAIADGLDSGSVRERKEAKKHQREQAAED